MPVTERDEDQNEPTQKPTVLPIDDARSIKDAGFERLKGDPHFRGMGLEPSGNDSAGLILVVHSTASDEELLAMKSSFAEVEVDVWDENGPRLLDPVDPLPAGE
jgi:hypothetical protein